MWPKHANPTARRLLGALLAGLVAATTALAETYEYDAAGRLTEIGYDDGREIRYAYDSRGNVTAITHRRVALDVDGDGTAATQTDGRLILRYLFGFRGAALAEGLLPEGAAPGRDTPAGIESFLAGTVDAFDVDGNGAARPLSDGLLVLRYLSGFGGDALVDRAIGANASADRDTGPEVSDYLGGLAP
jgi:YD repeat-containing protein